MKSLRLALLLILSLGAVAAASASDREFRGVVRAIEQTYGVHHMRIPFVGVATFFTRGEGLSGVHVAVFEDFEAPTDTSGVSRLIEESLGHDWYPFVRVHSDGETTLIYTNPTDNKMRMMIVTIEASEATVVEVNVSERAIEGWFKEPGETAKDSGHHHFD